MKGLMKMLCAAFLGGEGVAVIKKRGLFLNEKGEDLMMHYIRGSGRGIPALLIKMIKIQKM